MEREPVIPSRISRPATRSRISLLRGGARHDVPGVMFRPFMPPYALVTGGGATPEESLRFLFHGATAVLPMIAIYTAGVY